LQYTVDCLSRIQNKVSYIVRSRTLCEEQKEKFEFTSFG